MRPRRKGRDGRWRLRNREGEALGRRERIHSRPTMICAAADGASFGATHAVGSPSMSVKSDYSGLSEAARTTQGGLKPVSPAG
jgi:hypothetical protein